MPISTISSSFNVRSDTLTIWANYLNSIVSTLNSVISQINDDPSTYFKLADISTGLSLINSKLKVTDVRLSGDNDLASLRGGISAVNLSEVSTDFNSLVNHGIYYTTTALNTPESLTGGFFVLVLKKDTSVAQFAMHNSSNSVYFRFSNNTGTTFSDWNKCSSVTGNATVQGLVKLSDATDSTSDVDDGVAATPKAVNTAITELNIPATKTSLGRIKVGDTLDITSAGLLDINDTYTNNLKALILDLAHPIGSYYWSADLTDPGELFGGTWERIKDRFILAAGDTYTAGSTGGAASHTLTPAGTIGTHSLTVAELPAHSHGRGTTEIVGNLGFQSTGWFLTYTSGAFSKVANVNNKVAQNDEKSGSGYKQAHFAASSGWSGTSESKGSGTAHGHSWTGTQVTIDHMNPYKVAYCFMRVS